MGIQTRGLRVVSATEPPLREKPTRDYTPRRDSGLPRDARWTLAILLLAALGTSSLWLVPQVKGIAQARAEEGMAVRPCGGKR